MATLPRLPLGQQDFSEIRRSGRVYVDKTEFIYRMYSHSSQFFFLSRPRRFGKSLLINTLKALYLGQQPLFEGLYIYDKIEWETYPVLHFDFSVIGFRELGLVPAIEQHLDSLAQGYGLVLTNKGIGLKFSELMQKVHAATGKQAVVLIDEYDKPITDVLETVGNELAQQARETLRTFFGVVKGNSAHIRLFFLTGITRFSKVSLFSDLNNLYDLTFADEFHNLLGYTQQELETVFSEHLAHISQKQGINLQELLPQIKNWYNGYSWNGQGRVYNPFSILNFLENGQFMNYWFDSGTPKFLIGQLKEKMRYDLRNVAVSMATVNHFDFDHLALEALLFQSGYLTCTQKDEFGSLILNYPNKEVEEAMLQHLIGSFAENPNGGILAHDLAKAIRQHRLDLFIEALNTLFADIPAEIFLRKKEAYFHSVVFLALKLGGFQVSAEVRKSTGRIDAQLIYQKRLYLFEFKLDGSSQEAIAQIHQKGYEKSYKQQGFDIYLLGINFSSTTKDVADWQMEQIL